ncbi:MAG: GNAT family N-acetyltransferase [Bacillota bacterium]
MDSIIFLVEPQQTYKEAFQAMVREYENYGEEFYYGLYKKGLEDFDAYLQLLDSQTKGLGLPEGFVATRTYWLSDSTKKIHGVIRIRTSLDSEYVAKYIGNIGYDIAPLSRGKGYGTAILGLGLEKVKELKLRLEKVLITCARDNELSSRIIEKNGGVFESEIYDENDDQYMKRYWIEIV